MNVRKNENTLGVNPYSPPNIIIPAKTVDNAIFLFYKSYDKDEQFTWLEAPKDTIRQGVELTEYHLLLEEKKLTKFSQDNLVGKTVINF
ncbi:MAG: hypothetical protein U5M51_14925 [Emticicia sp.]|nr:hypothetical protein [Emticicia sp.]